MLINLPVPYDNCVLNVKAVVAAFNQEKALGLPRDYEPSDGPSFESLFHMHYNIVSILPQVKSFIFPL